MFILHCLLHSQVFKKMDPSQLLEKYQEATIEFENLVKSSVDGSFDIQSQLQKCTSLTRTLTSLETDPQFLPLLKDISSHMSFLSQKSSGESSSQNEERNQNGKRTRNEESDKSKRQDVIKSALRQTYGNGLKDIAGLEGVKAELRKSILLPIQFPSLFTGGRKHSCHILMYGPPGNGKSKIIVSIAEEAKIPLYCISNADLLSSWVGETEKMIRELFNYIKSLSRKCIIFIDEIDSICRKRSGREPDHTRRMKNQLLIELDDNLKNANSNCIVLCATNCPWDIDVAFLRRFQSRIYVPLPDSQSRRGILQLKCSDIKVKMSEDDWEKIVLKTEGYSGSDLTDIVNYAIQEPINELDRSQSWRLTKDSLWVPCPPETSNCLKGPLSIIPTDKVSIRHVVLNDFIKALSNIPKTVSNKILEKYNNFKI